MNFMNLVQEQVSQVVDSGQEEAGYMFGILTIEYNISPEEVEQALGHLDMFMMPSISDPTIQNWIRSVHGEVVLTLRRYETLDWGIVSRLRCQISHIATLQGAK
jgi:hypothetical protein